MRENRLEERVSEAVRFFWNQRKSQGKGSETTGEYVGRRAQVTGGKQLDGFVDLLQEILIEAGVPKECLFTSSDLELPGFYRANKKWDLLVVEDSHLLAAIELKSQVGPSFGNNFNNRTEEAMGSAMDIWTAYREGAFGLQSAPWLGYLMVLEDCERSRQPVRNREPHFKVFPEFDQASYQKRYEIFCGKLMLERKYSYTCFLTTQQSEDEAIYTYPSERLSFERFVHSMITHIHAQRMESGYAT